MATENSICSMLNEPSVVENQETGWSPEKLAMDTCCDNEAIRACVYDGYKGQWNNLAQGNLDFKWVPSELINPGANKIVPRVGDVCVRMMSVVTHNEQNQDHYSAIVDLYNTYVAKGSSLIAKMYINRCTGIDELYIPAIPIHLLVSEWNKSLMQFHDLIRCEDSSDNNSSLHVNRNTVISNVTQLALKNVPIISEHLWFVVHCIVSNPKLVSQVLQLVGTVASCSGKLYHTGEVENIMVPRDDHSASSMKLYLIARLVSPNTMGNGAKALGDQAGAMLGLIWASDEEDLHDHLRNFGHCYYVHIGTEAGNTFRCNGFCQWRSYDYKVFTRMVTIGHESALRFEGTMLAGNTGDSARFLSQI